ncbi:c-type heme family protein [Lacinutrix undariae]
MKNLILLVCISLFFFNCNNSKKKEYTAFEKQMEANKHPGKKLMETNCYTCHNSTDNQSDRIGPPMIAIKKHYINEATTKAQFIEEIKTWVKNPNADKAKMVGAVKEFGVMPKQSFPEETIAEIADYIYDFEIEQPEWFENHFNEEKGRNLKNDAQKEDLKANDDTLSYAKRGLKYALATKAILGKNLMGTIQKKGTLGALVFCNEQAYPLTDSMSVLYNAAIKRVSDKPRNLNNKANNKELMYINSFKNDIKNNIEPKPIVDQLNGKVHVYYPITTNSMCLQCHGNPETDIAKPTFSKLAVLYPNDKAIGYNINQVRGMWSVIFSKKEGSYE